MVNPRGGWVQTVLRHSPIHPALEPEDIAKLAHPVVAVKTESAAIAWHDLLGNDTVAERHPMLFGRAFAECDNVTGVLMSGYAWSFDCTPYSIFAPEQLASGETLHIGSADAARFDLDQHFARVWSWNRHLFDSVITWTIYVDRCHRLSQHHFSAFHARLFCSSRHQFTLET